LHDANALLTQDRIRALVEIDSKMRDQQETQWNR